MKESLKFIFAIILIVLISVSCKKREERTSMTPEENQKMEEKRKQDSLDAIKKDQYIMAEMFTGNKTQMIDLIKGPATFEIVHEGSGHFRAVLTDIEGKELLVLADVDGNYKGEKKYEAPETTAYLIDVKTDGRWNVKRK